MYRYIIIAATFLLPLQVAAGEHPTAFELLHKFAETQDKLQSFIYKKGWEVLYSLYQSLTPSFIHVARISFLE